MSSVADYVGRSIDVLAFQGVAAAGETRLSPALAAANQGGLLCSGIQKLAQRWLIEFLSERGSLPALPRRGCEFMGQLRRGELRTTVDAEQAFFLSAQQVKQNLAGEDPADAPLDEVLASAELLALAVAGDRLSLHVQLNSRAGSSRRVLLPLAVAIL